MVADPSFRVKMRSPCFSLSQTRYTMRVPSGDQLGNPAFGRPFVRSRGSEPSGRIVTMRAGLVRLSPKYEPTPAAIQSAAGAHAGKYAVLPFSKKIVREFDPSGFITVRFDSATSPPATTSNFPSREKAGNCCVYANSKSGLMLNKPPFCAHLFDALW